MSWQILKVKAVLCHLTSQWVHVVNIKYLKNRTQWHFEGLAAAAVERVNKL